ncbi:HBL/NHE enterotoxin family protein [Bacillus pseudomycoides]|uniref:HBL/NHE enterotoxin family protein n=2 Tax=Bacillus pseudomycoides TaxID=64104 RepID=UPI000BF19D81|nr:HBL/NHE enterotoxin family protein [Bacillus pseudomycoides]PEI91342.1 hemolysin [Bacillus pseudomycoides]PEM76211.1 hemolysin [Bacillus pseudomycoides]PGA62731.1 hemolysin [Bacillus pseudomycoides]PHA52247.1 hemolysin [Bacillus pseudomycoides]PHA52500.1 hemolysin [Bacillus pseudomycoides]
MMKKIPYKLLAVSTFLTLTTTSVVAPVATFASEMEQTTTGDTSLSANNEKMKTTLQKAGVFAKSMNAYSYMLIKNPDVNFEGITINGYADLPGKIVQDQKNARAHAVTWDTEVKKQLLNTLTGIVEFDTKFDTYYDTLVEAADTAAIEAQKSKELADKEGKDPQETPEGKMATAILKEGITDLRQDIQLNRDSAQKLIQELTKLRDAIGEDVRAFGSNKDQLQSILKNQGADVEADQKRLDEILGSVNYYKQLESDGYNVMKGALFGLPLIGGVIVLTAQENLKKLEPTLAELRKTVDDKVTLNRVVGLAHNNISEMHKALDEAINSLTYMSAQWNDLDAQYAGVLKNVDNAAKKSAAKSFIYLKLNLNSAQSSWKTLEADALTLKEGIKELKVEPLQK